MCYLTGSNTEWITYNKDKIRNKMLSDNKGLKIICTNSKDNESINGDWLQGGILNMLRRNISNLLKSSLIHIDNLEK